MLGTWSERRWTGAAAALLVWGFAWCAALGTFFLPLYIANSWDRLSTQPAQSAEHTRLGCISQSRDPKLSLGSQNLGFVLSQRKDHGLSSS